MLQGLTLRTSSEDHWLLTGKKEMNPNDVSPFVKPLHELLVLWSPSFCMTVFRLSLKFFITSAEQLIPSYLSIKNNPLLPCSTSETGAFRWNYCMPIILGVSWVCVSISGGLILSYVETCCVADTDISSYEQLSMWHLCNSHLLGVRKPYAHNL